MRRFVLGLAQDFTETLAPRVPARGASASRKSPRCDLNAPARPHVGQTKRRHAS